MTLTDEQCAVLEKITSKSKMDCWFCIDGDNQIRDLEEGEKVIDTMEGVRLLQEGMSCYADYDLTYREIYIFEHIPGLVVQPEPVSYTHLDVYKRQRNRSAAEHPSAPCVRVP